MSLLVGTTQRNAICLTSAMNFMSFAKLKSHIVGTKR